MMNLFNCYELSAEDKAAVKRWLLEFQVANEMSYDEMFSFVRYNKGWILDNVFPSDDDEEL